MSKRKHLWNRREVLAASLAPALVHTESASAQAAPVAKPMTVSSKLYESIGVRPFINARGTFTILTGSQTLPEVKQAMTEASRHFVHMDELMEAVGKRVAEITKAEWGIVTAGCAAAIAHATAACVAGGDPEKMQRLPKIDWGKNEVVMPRYARNQYDHAARMTGVTIVEVTTEDELRAALGPRAAMAMIMSGPAAERGPLAIENFCKIAKSRNVPVLIDAAAEELTIPNHHLARGATMVAYSGGKCIRGPQTGGLLLGPKPLLQAAWMNSAPHHAFGRAMKAGKEEIMGMLTALEMWPRRDHKAEWKAWETWIEAIRKEATRVDGVSGEVMQPADLSNHAPQLRLTWDAAKVGVTGREVARALDAGSPRIIVANSAGERPERMASSLTVMPYMMNPGEEAIVARALYQALSKPAPVDAKPPSTEQAASVAGQWQAEIRFSSGSATHQLTFEQEGAALKGRHKMSFLENPLTGQVRGAEVTFRSSHRYEGTSLGYDFKGRVSGQEMTGEVGLGEYGTASFTARRVG